jgi:putative transcriptional regulator
MHVTTSRDILMAIAKGEGPSRYLLALGYAGWTAGQLEQEMRDNVWLAVPANSHILFDLPASERLTAAIGLLGVDWRQLSSEAGHA